MSNSKVQRTNAERFIMAYNQIDHSLRAIYGFKRSISYADLIRKAVPMSSVVRKYEDELIDYGRLRNSIVHKTNPNYVIAEPHEEVVEDFEKIAKLISTPPTALSRVCKREVLIAEASVNVEEILKLMAESGFKNIPVYRQNVMVGVAVGTEILDHLGHCVIEHRDLGEYLRTTPIGEVVLRPEQSLIYKVTDKNLTIERALNMFYLNRRLQLIIITEHGRLNEQPLGVVTVADILDMNAVLENY
jgi:predicted transcriptional regulator